MAGEAVSIPDGESPEKFQKRVMEAFEGVVNGLLHTGDTEAVICTHGGVISLILMAYALPRLEMSDCVAAARETASSCVSRPLSGRGSRWRRPCA